MEKEKFVETIERMTEADRQVATILYLKDIKDLLESLLDSQGVEKKHY